MKLLPRALASIETAGVEGVARFLIVGEGVAQHQRGIFRELVVEFAGGFRLFAGNGREGGGDLARRQAWEISRGEERIYGGSGGGVDIRADLAAIMLLFGGDIVERLVLDDRAAQGKAGAKAAEGGLARFGLERIARIEGAVLREKEGVAVNGVGAGARDDVDRAARGAAGFGGETVVDDLKFLDDFRGQFGAAGAGEFVVVVEAVDGDVIAAGAKAAEREAAAAKRRRAAHTGCRR